MMTHIEIKARASGAVLFAHEADGNSLRMTVEAAVLASANLRGADLRDADLGCAYLGGADLSGADLGCAYLRGADLGGADLGGADLSGADLGGAYLSGAYLSGAYLRGGRPILTIGPIGSRCAYVVAYLTDKGVYISAGCFFGTRLEFETKVKHEHGDNIHGKEYRAALAMIDAHAALWAEREVGDA